MSLPIVSLRRLKVAFGTRVVLRDLSLDVASKGCTVLLGPSGTGKSTLLRLLAGALSDHPTLRVSGEMQYGGQPLGDDDRPALIAQKSHQLMSTVWEAFASGLAQRAQMPRAEQFERISALLKETGQPVLLTLLQKQLVDLPLAQQRVVMILHTALSSPALLMVDEPTADLPDEDVQNLIRTLRAISRRIPLLVVSHHLEQTRQLADHVLLMANGALQEGAPRADFFERPESDSARQFLRTGSCAEVSPPMMPSGFATSGPRGFVWLLEGIVAGTPKPGVIADVLHDLQCLQNVGITWLISLTETPFPSEVATPYGIRVLACPIPDMKAPSITQAARMCTDIDRLCINSEVVAVHCKAGLGRTGTMLAAYWMWHHRTCANAEQALRQVRRQRSGMVQSQVQEDFLAEFERFLKGDPSRMPARHHADNAARHPSTPLATAD